MSAFERVASVRGSRIPPPRRPNLHVVRQEDTVEAPETSVHRPVRFSEMVGQTNLLMRLETHLRAAMARGTQPGHVLLDGPPGFGKTTLAKGISGELSSGGVDSVFHEITADAISNPRKLAIELGKINEGDVFFVDEIQGLKPSVQVSLLRALEDFVMYVEGSNKTPALRFDVPRFTLVGATTHPGKLSDALRSRFKFTGHLQPYDFDDLQLVLLSYAERVGFQMSSEAAEVIAKASRYTPRIGISLADSVRDYAFEVTRDLNCIIDGETAKQGLEYAEVDIWGLNDRDRRVLTVMLEDFDGGPVGVTPLCGKLGIHHTELTRDIEPYLLQAGLWALLAGGRGATRDTWLVMTGKVPALINGRR